MKKNNTAAKIQTVETSGLHVVKETTKAPRARKEKVEKDPHTLGVVEQVKVVFSRQHRIAAFIGFLGGAWIPVAGFVSVHHELNYTQPLYTQVAAYVALLCLGFSLPKVSVWGGKAFGNTFAGLCFAMATEIVMVCSSTPWLSAVGLALLVGINGVSVATHFALPKKHLTDLYS